MLRTSLHKQYHYHLSETLWIDITVQWRPTSLMGGWLASLEYGNQHSSLETNISHRKPTFLIGNRLSTLETDIPRRKPTFLVGNRHSLSETDIPLWKPTFLIGNRHSLSETDIPQGKPTFLIRNRLASSSETYPWDQLARFKTYQWWVSYPA